MFIKVKSFITWSMKTMNRSFDLPAGEYVGEVQGCSFRKGFDDEEFVVLEVVIRTDRTIDSVDWEKL